MSLWMRTAMSTPIVPLPLSCLRRKATPLSRWIVISLDNSVVSS